MNKVAVIHITDKCNLRCPHCLWIHNDKTGSEMPMSEYRNIIGYLKNNGYNRLLLQSEGEVLMHSQYREMVNYANENEVIINKVITNGQLLDKFVDMIKHMHMVISLDGYTADRYAKRRGGTQKQFDKVIDNIKLAVSITDRKKITINYILMSGDHKDVIDVIKFCEKLGVNTIRFHQYNPVVSKYKAIKPDDDFLNFIRELTTRNDFDINIKLNLPGQYHKKCLCVQIVNDRITIGLNGYVTPCCHIHSNKKYGTYDNQNPLMSEFRNKFYDSTNILELPIECQKCPRLGLASINYRKMTREWRFEGMLRESSKLV